METDLSADELRERALTRIEEAPKGILKGLDKSCLDKSWRTRGQCRDDDSSTTESVIASPCMNVSIR